MVKYVSMKKHFLKNTAFLVLLLFPVLLCAQSNFTGLSNIEANVNFETDSLWTFDFDLARRDVLYDQERFEIQGQHFEFTQVTQLKIGDGFKLGAGLRYYTKNLFNDEKQDELRVLQQLSYKKKSTTIAFKHRFRFSQRFRERISLRSRYRFGIEFPLSNSTSNKNPLYLSLQTESVLEFGKYEKPSFGQRLASKIGFELFEQTSASLGFEYRYRDYTNNPYTQLYFLAGISLSL